MITFEMPLFEIVRGVFRSVPVQKHLEKVYATLAATLLLSAVGVYTNIVTGLGGLLAIIGCVVCMTWLTLTEPTPFNLNKRSAPPFSHPILTVIRAVYYEPDMMLTGTLPAFPTWSRGKVHPMSLLHASAALHQNYEI